MEASFSSMVCPVEGDSLLEGDVAVGDGVTGGDAVTDGIDTAGGVEAADGDGVIDGVELNEVDGVEDTDGLTVAVGGEDEVAADGSAAGAVGVDGLNMIVPEPYVCFLWLPVEPDENGVLADVSVDVCACGLATAAADEVFGGNMIAVPGLPELPESPVPPGCFTPGVKITADCCGGFFSSSPSPLVASSGSSPIF